VLGLCGKYGEERLEERLALEPVGVDLKMKLELEAMIGGAAGTPSRSGTLEKGLDRPLLVLRELIGEIMHGLSLPSFGTVKVPASTRPGLFVGLLSMDFGAVGEVSQTVVLGRRQTRRSQVPSRTMPLDVDTFPKNGCTKDVRRTAHRALGRAFRIYNWLRDRDSNPEPCG
jgi:hypothetical protein